jgi:hypothetical protein
MTKEFTIEISAGAVAWYGAIVASLSFLFSAYQIWRDSARISIELETRLYLYNTEPLYKSNTEYIGVSVINRGRRPLKITHASFLILGSEGKLLLTDSFANHRAQVLTEENPKTQFLVEASLVDMNKVWCVLISDAAGREYKKYIKKTPSILRIYYFLRKKILKESASKK